LVRGLFLRDAQRRSAISDGDARGPLKRYAELCRLEARR